METSYSIILAIFSVWAVYLIWFFDINKWHFKIGDHVYRKDKDGFLAGEIIGWMPHQGYRIKGVHALNNRTPEYCTFLVGEDGFKKYRFKKTVWWYRQLLKRL